VREESEPGSGDPAVRDVGAREERDRGPGGGVDLAVGVDQAAAAPLHRGDRVGGPVEGKETLG
jgi:hypothetical protein